jgi:hypothetical protein
VRPRRHPQHDPAVAVVLLKSSDAGQLSQRHLLLYMLGIPALVQAAVAATSIVGERQQGTLEPALTTPISREELVVGKALAPLIPSVAIAYAVYACFLACVELLATTGRSAGAHPRPGHSRSADLHPAHRRVVDLDRHHDLGQIERHPRRAAAQHPREPPVGHRDHSRRVRRHPRHARSCARPRGDAVARQRTRLAHRLDDARPRAARDRNQSATSPAEGGADSGQLS